MLSKCTSRGAHSVNTLSQNDQNLDPPTLPPCLHLFYFGTSLHLSVPHVLPNINGINYSNFNWIIYTADLGNLLSFSSNYCKQLL